IDFLSELSRKAQGKGGQGLSFLIERNNSPSRRRLQKLISDKFPQARWYVHEPVDLDVHRRAASQAFVQPVKPFYQFDKADVVVQVAGALAIWILGQDRGVTGLENLGRAAGLDPKWISECAKDLAANKGRSLVVAGYRQPMTVHLLAHAINNALGNVGQTVV